MIPAFSRSILLCTLVRERPQPGELRDLTRPFSRNATRSFSSMLSGDSPYFAYMCRLCPKTSEFTLLFAGLRINYNWRLVERYRCIGAGNRFHDRGCWAAAEIMRSRSSIARSNWTGWKRLRLS